MSCALIYNALYYLEIINATILIRGVLWQVSEKNRNLAENIKGGL